MLPGLLLLDMFDWFRQLVEDQTMFEVSRRDLVLGAAGAYAAFGLDRPIGFVGAAYGQQSVTPSFRKYQVGEIEVFSLIDGMREIPLRDGMIKNVAVEQIKAALRAAGLPDTHAPLVFTATAVRFRDQLALIDSGTGGHPIYGQGNGKLLQSMAAAGLNPKAVKTILISHLHGDHIYGLMNHETNAQVFPDAEIVVPAAELRWWTRPGVESIDLGPTRKGLAQRIGVTLAGWKNVRPFEGEPELLPGVHAVRAPGHSPGHVAFLITSGGKQFLISADVSVLALHISTNPEWQQAIDQDPQMAVETRKKIFDRAVADNLTISGTHWLMPNVGTLAKDGNGYVFAAEA
jgi:glyoxylase-like metal-dependent hydrolase (beta-lactamase superfamily II)